MTCEEVWYRAMFANTWLMLSYSTLICIATYDTSNQHLQSANDELQRTVLHEVRCESQWLLFNRWRAQEISWQCMRAFA